MRLPNLIIAGVPKAGSSSLFYWLEAHPEIYGAPCKETFYFIDRDSPLLRPEANYNLHGLERYQDFFPDCPENIKIVLDGTPHYIYQKTALEFFANCDSQPHVIFMLRKPSKRMFSSFSFGQNNLGLIDSELTFERATDIVLDQTGSLLKELDYPQNSATCRWLGVQLSKGRYYDFIAPWIELFPKEKIHIILFEEMIANPQSTMIRLAEKLDINTDFYREFHFESRTKTMAIKNRFTHNLLLKLAPYFGTSKTRSFLKSLYFKFNTSPPKPAKSVSLERLDDYFRPYNQQLAEAFNINLDLWN